MIIGDFGSVSPVPDRLSDSHLLYNTILQIKYDNIIMVICHICLCPRFVKWKFVVIWQNIYQALFQ